MAELTSVQQAKCLNNKANINSDGKRQLTFSHMNKYQVCLGSYNDEKQNNQFQQHFGRIIAKSTKSKNTDTSRKTTQQLFEKNKSISATQHNQHINNQHNNKLTK